MRIMNKIKYTDAFYKKKWETSHKKIEMLALFKTLMRLEQTSLLLKR